MIAMPMNTMPWKRYRHEKPFIFALLKLNMRGWFKSYAERKAEQAVMQKQVIERRKVFLAFNSYACLRA